MKIFVGLGNPGETYTKTRHNIGFIALDSFLRSISTDGRFLFEKKFNADIAEIHVSGEKILLVKPLTFMNNSGESVQKIVSYYDLNPEEDLIIVYDEIDLPFGEVRTSGSSAGGHNGMKSIITHLGSNKIQRVRIGVANSHSKKTETAHFVLDAFSKNEQEEIQEILLTKIEDTLMGYIPTV